MRSLFLSLALVACGPAAKPHGTIVAPTGGKPVAPLAPVAATTCAEAGILLRGPVDNEAENQEAGPTRATAIAEACTEGKWTVEQLHCVADSPDPQPCLDKLTDAQHELYDQKLVAWAEKFSAEIGGDEPIDSYVDCDDGVGNVAMYAPAIALTGADGDFAIAMRRRAVVRMCNQQLWDIPLKHCMQEAHDAAAIQACEARLAPDQLTALAGRIAQLDALVTTTFAKRKKPPSCAAVVGVHYADAAWKGKLDLVKPAERKKAIADSRARMMKACTTEAWEPTVRACMFAGGGEQCFTTASFPWLFPATGVLATSSGVPECDVYGDAMTRIQNCQKIPRATRDSFKDSFDAMRETFAQLKAMDASVRDAMADACRQGTEALQTMLTTNGC